MELSKFTRNKSLSFLFETYNEDSHVLYRYEESIHKCFTVQLLDNYLCQK